MISLDESVVEVSKHVPRRFLNVHRKLCVITGFIMAVGAVTPCARTSNVQGSSIKARQRYMAIKHTKLNVSAMTRLKAQHSGNKRGGMNSH